MCLIIHKPKGQLLGEDVLQDAWNYNHDGWGIMYTDRGLIHSMHGMNYSALKYYVEKLRDEEYFLHLRMATHGLPQIELCHPFKVNDDLFMMHNGIINLYTKNTNNQVSDSLIYSKHLNLSLKDSSQIFEPSWQKKQLDILTNRNVIVLLHKSGEYVTINKQNGVNFRGMWFSNEYAWSIYEREMFGDYGDYSEDEEYYILHQMTFKDLQGLSKDMIYHICENYPERVAELISQSSEKYSLLPRKSKRF